MEMAKKQTKINGKWKNSEITYMEMNLNFSHEERCSV